MKRRYDDDDDPIVTPEWQFHLALAMGFGLVAFGITKLLGLW